MAMVTRSSQIYGIVLLIFVNVVWVAASEITRYLFIDLGFKRPFFFTYAKSCMLSLFLLRYACVCTTINKSAKKSGKAFYSRLNDYDEGSGDDEEASEDDTDYFDTTLTEAEFEQILATDIESNTGELSAPELASQQNSNVSNDQQQQPKESRRRRHVRFNKFREVRSWPEKLEEAAKMARRPFKQTEGKLCGNFSSLSTSTKYILFNYSVYFAPLWLISSVTYQTALAYSSVSSVNLISASSPLFVLLFGTLFSRYSIDSFNWFKLCMVLMNFFGVCIVSRFSDSWIGSAISLLSAFSNALYLFVLSRLSVKEEHVDMPLMLGIVGIFSLLVCTPLMLVLHATGIEPQLPIPSLHQMSVLIVNAFLGTLFADSLWLYATLLTGSLTSSMSGSLGIPLSMLADSFFRNQPPNMWEMISAIPIMISFIGASYHTTISNSALHLPLENTATTTTEPESSSASANHSQSQSFPASSSQQVKM